MATPADPRLAAEAALLGELLQTDAALAPAEIEFLRERGFLPVPPRSPAHDDYEYDHDEPSEEEDAVADPPQRRRLGRPRRRTDWSPADLGAYLGDHLEQARDLLLPLAHLAPEADSWGEVLATLRKLDLPTVVERLGQTLETDCLPLAALWSAMTHDTFRQPCAATGPAYRAYRAVLQAADRAQLPGKYTWILRQDEVQAIWQLVVVQRTLLRASGQLWRERPALVARHLRHHPHPLALLAHVLLFNSQPAGSTARAWTPREESFASLPPLDHAAAYRRPWTLAIQMDSDAILPYLVGFFRPDAGQLLACPAGWNELGYRIRGGGP